MYVAAEISPSTLCGDRSISQEKNTMRLFFKKKKHKSCVLALHFSQAKRSEAKEIKIQS